MQQLELLQQQFARSLKMPSFPNVFAALQQLQQLQRLLEGGLYCLAALLIIELDPGHLA
jgi:hypothetical protein